MNTPEDADGSDSKKIENPTINDVRKSISVCEDSNAQKSSGSPEAGDKEGAEKIEVRFAIIGQGGNGFRRSFAKSCTVGEIRRKLSRILHTSTVDLALFKDECPLQDEATLSSIALDAIVIELDLMARGDFRLELEKNPDEDEPKRVTVVVAPPPPANITCKFYAAAQERTFTRSFKSSTTVQEVKRSLHGLLGVATPDALLLVRDRSILDDAAPLSALGHDAFGNLDLELHTKDATRMRFDALYQDVPVADVLTVAIVIAPDRVLSVNVEVVDATIEKPYLGGYRDKHTGLEYHHAYSQTSNYRPRLPPERRNHRDTQTVRVRDRSTAMGTGRSTQTQPYDVPHLTDVVVSPRPYVSHEDKTRKINPATHDELEAAARVVQRSWRAHRCRNRVQNWRMQCRRRQELADEEMAEELRLRDARLEKEERARTFPRTKDDFDRLYAMVDRWRDAEIGRISKLHPKAPKVAEFCLLLDKEVQLLRSIEKHRIDAVDEVRTSKERRFLEDAARPKAWRNARGDLVAMDTIEAQRVRKFEEFYSKLVDDDDAPERRMEALVALKFALGDYEGSSALADRLASLVERECELLVRNVPAHKLSALRKRIRSTLVRFVERDVTATKKYKMSDRKDGPFRCAQCDRVKPRDEFDVHARTDRLRTCLACARDRLDLAPFEFMLRALRRDELRASRSASLAPASAACFVVRAADVRFLVERVWHARSAIGDEAASDPLSLRLCRWRNEERWSPWNCVLLSLAEAKTHARLRGDPERVYDAELVAKVRHRHLLARLHFERPLRTIEGVEATNNY